MVCGLSREGGICGSKGRICGGSEGCVGIGGALSSEGGIGGSKGCVGMGGSLLAESGVGQERGI